MNKQIVFMVVTTGIALIGSLGWGPFLGSLIYYVYAVMRPQFMWKWSLPNLEFGWSYWVAMAAIVTTVIARVGLMYFPSYGPSRGAKQLKWNLVNWFFAGFALWVALSFVRAFNQNYALPYMTEYVKIFVMFFVATYAIQRISQLWILLAALAFSTIFVAYEINFHYFVNGYMQLQQTGFGGLDNNGAGLMIAMGIPMCFFLWEGTVSRFRWVYLAGIPLIAHAVMLSFSRGAMLSVLVALPVLFAFSRQKKILILVYMMGAVFIGVTAGPELQDRFFSISEHDVDASANSRKTSWLIAIRMANESPIFGLGVRCSCLLTQAYGADMQNRAIHSQYLQIAADNGWLGLAWYLLLLAGTFFVCSFMWWRIRKWPKYASVKRTQALAGAVVSSLTLFSVGAVFLSLDNVELPYIVIFMGIQLWSIYKAQGIEASVWSNQEVPSDWYVRQPGSPVFVEGYGYIQPQQPRQQILRQPVARPYPGTFQSDVVPLSKDPSV